MSESKQIEQVSAPTESQAMITMIERAAVNPDVDMEKMERLWVMKKEMDARAAEMAFNAAMSAVQSEIGRIAADATNPQTHSRYASYSALDKIIRPIYTKHGLSLSFDTGEPLDLAVRVLCYVSHEAGHTRTYHVDMAADGKGAKGGDVMTKTHAAGSAMSYGMRYLLKMIFNIAVGEDDDDGNGAAYERITASQAADLRSLLEEHGKNEKAFLNWVKADTIENINAASLKDCIAAIKRKKTAA